VIEHQNRASWPTEMAKGIYAIGFEQLGLGNAIALYLFIGMSG
jgi:hypothetical protein